MALDTNALGLAEFDLLSWVAQFSADQPTVMHSGAGEPDALAVVVKETGVPLEAC